MVTCTECMEALLVADITATGFRAYSADDTDPSVIDLDAHVSGCERCARAAEILRAAQEGLSSSLVLASAHGDTSQATANYAYTRLRRERFVWWRVMPGIFFCFVVGAAVIATSFGPALRRYFTPPPAVETRTFSLSCLSGEQAAKLLTPYLPSPQNPMWQAEAFDVRPAGGGIRGVTVRAPRATLAVVPELLAGFERDPNAACRRR